MRTELRKAPGMLGRLRERLGVLGPILLLLVLTVVAFGPALAPYAPTDTIGIPGSTPSGSSWLGTDQVGRDVLSRVMAGGRITLGLATAATLVGYAAAAAAGLAAGYFRGWVDTLLMRIVDFLIVFPPLILLLILASGIDNPLIVLVGGVALVQVPGMSRVVRTATLEVSHRGFVEAAVARGERSWAVIRREILPNIIEAMIATLGLRFAFAVILISSVNFLGVGLQPPAPDWGLMVAENRQLIGINSASVLAPAVMIGLLAIAFTLMGDSYVRSLGRSAGKDEK